MGCVDAPEFEVVHKPYLGGQTDKCSPLTAARVHNGLGILFPPTFLLELML